MDENLIKPISPASAGVKNASKKKHRNARKVKKRNKDKSKLKNSSSTRGNVIDDYA